MSPPFLPLICIILPFRSPDLTTARGLKNSPTQPALKRWVSNLDAIVLRPFLELLLWMNINKIINRKVSFWTIYLKTQMFLCSNEIRFTIPVVWISSEYFERLLEEKTTQRNRMKFRLQFQRNVSFTTKIFNRCDENHTTKLCWIL